MKRVLGATRPAKALELMTRSSHPRRVAAFTSLAHKLLSSDGSVGCPPPKQKQCIANGSDNAVPLEVITAR